MMKLTKRFALDAAITAVYAALNEGKIEYREAGTNNTFSAYEIIEKLCDIYRELKEDE